MSWLPKSPKARRRLTLVAVIGAPAAKPGRKPPVREQADLFPMIAPKAL